MRTNNCLRLRDDLRLAVLNYADVRRLRGYRDLAEMEALFQAIIDCAGRLIEAEQEWLNEQR